MENALIGGSIGIVFLYLMAGVLSLLSGDSWHGWLRG